MERLRIFLFTVTVSVQIISPGSTNELPQPKLSIEPKWKIFYTTEKVILNCSLDENSNKWDYEWFRNGGPLEKNESISLSGNTLSISSAKAGHSGQYTCRGKHLTRPSVTTNQTQAAQLQINEPPEPQVQSNWTEAFTGEKVSLQCVIHNVSKNWKYMWFKNSSKIVSSENTLTLSVESSDNAAYECQAELQGRDVTTAKSTPHLLEVKEPPKPQVQSNWTEAFTGEKVSLQCVIHNVSENWKYMWFKNLNKIFSSENTLTLSVESSDNAAYECQAELQGRNVTTAKSTPHLLEVKELPQPKLSIEPKWSIFYPTENVTLKCSINEDSNKWGYEWFSNGSQLHKDIFLSGNTLSISSAKAGHSGQYTCRGKHLMRTSVTTNQTEAVQLCVQDNTPKPNITKHEWYEFFYTEEQVQLHCNMPGEGWKYHWYKDSNLQITHSELTIKSASVAGTDVYQCKAQRGSFSVESETVQVQVQKPPEPQIQSNYTEAFPGEKVSLQCVIQNVSKNWNYLWFKGSDKIVPSDKTSINGSTLTLSVESSHNGAYECQAELQGRKVKTVKSTPHSLTVHGSKPTLLLEQDPPDSEIYTGEQVRLNCSIKEKTSQWEYLWKKDSAQVNNDHIYTISSATPSHNGLYTCQVERRGITFPSEQSKKLTIKKRPQLELSIESQWNILYATEKVTLKCSINEDSNKWGYEWFRNGAQVHKNEDISFPANTLSISSAKAGHSGQYTCRGQYLMRPSVTTTQTQAVQLQINDDTPKPTITKDKWFKFFYTEEQVQLYCYMPGEGWEYNWYKDSKLRITNSKLTIDSASLTDTGVYHCKAKRGDFSVDSETLRVQVQKPPEPKIQSNYTEAFPGEKVPLLCVIQNASKNWNYLWFKGSDKIGSSSETDINGNTLTLSIQSSYNRAYECQAELQGRKVRTVKSTPHLLTVHGSQPTLLLEQDPSDSDTYTGEQVNLKCSIKEKTSQWEYLWKKDSAQVNSNPIYTISSADLSHDGTYTCEVRRKGFTSKQSKKVTIKERPQPKLSLEPRWNLFYPTEKVTLKCSIDEDSNKWGYQWFRNGTQVHKNEDISFPANTLYISSAKASHSGKYTCRGKHLKRTSVTTTQTQAVELQIKDTTPNVIITKHKWFELFYTEEQVQLHCNMPGDGWKYHWHKGSNHLTTNPEFTIDSVSLDDTGDFHCKAQRGDFSVVSETLKVQVEACPPAFLSLETELSDIMTGDMTLRCNVSDGRQWNYTWYMNGQQLNESSSVLKVTGNEETIKSEFKCKGIHTERPLYSALSDGFTANNIIFKRKILLAISGCLVCSIVILIIGCIVLKITRKPEVKETAPEDLFFSMTDSKNQTVSPMKEYLDNRPKELEECQEKEELITDRVSAVHEDGVIKDEATPASEVNGLTSFKG
ncbi:hypothetical protein Q8A67_016708 [Cirrhinus molitorella]|uniref:Ig-like domain-containing protein n=1 Tax=Cirrhinus molitorella TaxID=172907 RepID=A0AA88TI90_9TELE|nr:hypothetical protein Q8A67_016708 [Cirrhinus molitorella]